MVVPHPGKEQAPCLQGQGYTCVSQLAPLCGRLAPTGHSSCSNALAGKTFELHSLTQDQAEGHLGLSCLGDLGLITSTFTARYSRD